MRQNAGFHPRGPAHLRGLTPMWGKVVPQLLSHFRFVKYSCNRGIAQGRDRREREENISFLRQAIRLSDDVWCSTHHFAEKRKLGRFCFDSSLREIRTVVVAARWTPVVCDS